VPVGPLDEVGDLAATFNLMVERLLESRERIEYLQRVAAWQQLARRLAHEIKNPLTPIQLAVQELRDRYKGDDEDFKRVLNQATEIVVEEVEVLRRLTGEFSAFAKLPEVNATPVDLRDFLGDAAQALEILPTDRGTITVELPEEEVSVKIDRMLMKRVLDNLVRNALEAIDGSGENGQVVVRGGRDAAGHPFVVVEDTGPGIERDEQQRVFEPYYTTKETGTGLGLAIVKKIVLEHDGLVTLSARKGHGTRFTIRFQP
jgi:nitrogen fixation/metabolism regulation signal transduction histidine kinase